jgi:hypothetical protein
MDVDICRLVEPVYLVVRDITGRDDSVVELLVQSSAFGPLANEYELEITIRKHLLNDCPQEHHTFLCRDSADI